MPIEMFARCLLFTGVPLLFAANPITVIVPGSADPWLAGLPNGSVATCDTSGNCDFAPGQLPVPVPITLVEGTTLTFDASGTAAAGPAGNPFVGPDGDPNFSTCVRGQPLNGIPNLCGPAMELAGVFLGPGLATSFRIGSHASIVVPHGATQLFLGTQELWDWFNNLGFFNVTITVACQVDPNDIKHSTVPLPGETYSLDGKPTSIHATFQPGATAGNPVGLTAMATACNFQGFDWQQTITMLPCPSPFYLLNPSGAGANNLCSNGSLTAFPPYAFNDPPFGGYLIHQPGSPPTIAGVGNFPFYYSTSAVVPTFTPQFCAYTPYRTNGIPQCNLPIIYPEIPVVSGDGTTLSFHDAPADSLLSPLSLFPPPGPGFGFTTALVGINQDGTASHHLYEWTWTDNYNGTAGGISSTLSDGPVDPGSGTGGITITSINGVPQTPPSVSCGATPNTLWPPNGKSVLVTVSGIITPGTSPLVPGGTTYAVIDEYGQVQPSGGIALGAGGTYSFGVSLVAARNGNDQNGRTYTIVVGGKDSIGNVDSCSAVVTVPHDQRN